MLVVDQDSGIDVEPALIAQHYTVAEAYEVATQWWLRAGEQSKQQLFLMCLA